MTSGRHIARRIAGLREIRSIMKSMRSLAFIEVRKLDRRMASQAEVVKGIDAAARDLLAFFPGLLPSPANLPQAEILVGSERGFCGDFNESIWSAVNDGAATGGMRIGVGHKLRMHMEGDERTFAVIDGPGVAEDIERVLASLVETVTRLQHERGAVALVARCHDASGGQQPVLRALLPPWTEPDGEPKERRVPPLLNVPADQLMRALVDQHLFAALHQVLLGSLLAENQQRARHLDMAVNRLDERLLALERTGRQLRQEEITEEIEVILLSAAGSP